MAPRWYICKREYLVEVKINDAFVTVLILLQIISIAKYIAVAEDL